MFEPTWTWHNFPFGQLYMWIGAKNDQIWLPMGWMSDSKQFSNQFEFGQTRLLGRPQPQMYPPVTLNQYILVNRTHKHFIYMLQGPTNIDFRPKLSNQQHVKYGSNLMNIFHNFVSIFGGSWGSICWFQRYYSVIKTSSHWRHMYKATRSPEISREQVQKLTPQFLLYIYIGYRFPLSLIIYYLGKPPSS